MTIIPYGICRSCFGAFFQQDSQKKPQMLCCMFTGAALACAGFFTHEVAETKVNQVMVLQEPMSSPSVHYGKNNIFQILTFAKSNMGLI